MAVATGAARATKGLVPPKSNWAFPLERPPYIGYPLTCAITFTSVLRSATFGRLAGAHAAQSPTGRV